MRGHLAHRGAGLATLTKGPIGFLLPGATFFLWLIWKRDLKELRKPIWLLAALLFAAIVLPWHLAAWRAKVQAEWPNISLEKTGDSAADVSFGDGIRVSARSASPDPTTRKPHVLLSRPHARVVGAHDPAA